MSPRAKNKAVPETPSTDFRIHVMMRDDMLMLINPTARRFDTALHHDRSLDNMRVHVADASMIGAIHDGGLSLHRRARSFTWRSRYSRSLGSPWFLPLGMAQRHGGQQRQNANPDSSP
jgi:hypothetical protein